MSKLIMSLQGCGVLALITVVIVLLQFRVAADDIIMEADIPCTFKEWSGSESLYLTLECNSEEESLSDGTLLRKYMEYPKHPPLVCDRDLVGDLVNCRIQE